MFNFCCFSFSSDKKMLMTTYMCSYPISLYISSLEGGETRLEVCRMSKEKKNWGNKNLKCGTSINLKPPPIHQLHQSAKNKSAADLITVPSPKTPAAAKPIFNSLFEQADELRDSMDIKSFCLIYKWIFP